jgi:hypothetical protein
VSWSQACKDVSPETEDCISGFCTSFRFLNYRTHIFFFLKLDLVLSSGQGREAPILLGPLERANINH